MMIYLGVITTVLTYFFIREFIHMNKTLNNINRNIKTISFAQDDKARGYKSVDLPYLELATIAIKKRIEEIEKKERRNEVLPEVQGQAMFNEESIRREQNIASLTIDILKTYHYDIPVLEARARAEGIVTQLDESMMSQPTELVEEPVSEVQVQEPTNPAIQ